MDIPAFVKGDFANFYTRDVRRAGEAREHVARCSSSTRGTWAGAIRARPIRCRTTSCGSSACSGSTAAAAASGSRVARPDGAGRPMPRPGGGSDVFVTRLHVRYDGTTSPRISCSRRPATAPTSRAATSCGTPGPVSATCERDEAYQRELAQRHESEAQTLASLTGWESRTSGRRWAAAPRPRRRPETTGLVGADLEVGRPQPRESLPSERRAGRRWRSDGRFEPGPAAMPGLAAASDAWTRTQKATPTRSCWSRRPHCTP